MKPKPTSPIRAIPRLRCRDTLSEADNFFYMTDRKEQV
jgi:hypothetical protein